MFKVRANHLTLLRILLLPIPCVLLYYGGHVAQFTALGVASLLGFTDYLDGWLARRHGATRFGILFDPIADKVFIAAVYIPLAYRDYLPLGLAAAIIFRELLVTELRRYLSGEGGLPVTPLAKIKTSVQMVGAGFLVMIHLLPEERVIIPLLALPFLATLVMGLFKSRLGLRWFAAAVFFALALFVRILFGPSEAAWIYGLVIVAFTWYTGLQYIRLAWRRLSFTLANGLRIFLAVAPPLGLIFLLSHLSSEASWLIPVALSFEFLSQGVDLLVCETGSRDFSFIKRGLIWPLFWGGSFFVPLFWAVAALTLALGAYALFDLRYHRRLLYS
ncbi:CDP-alcohol phosphatidyltransferase family protein [Thermosulfuriphilus sp.]